MDPDDPEDGHHFLFSVPAGSDANLSFGLIDNSGMGSDSGSEPGRDSGSEPAADSFLCLQTTQPQFWRCSPVCGCGTDPSTWLPW